MYRPAYVIISYNILQCLKAEKRKKTRSGREVTMSKTKEMVRVLDYTVYNLVLVLLYVEKRLFVRNKSSLLYWSRMTYLSHFSSNF